MGRALANESDTAFRAPLFEAGDPRLMREPPPAFRAQTRSSRAHGGAALSSASSSASPSLAASGTTTLSVSSSLTFHLDLPVGHRRPTSHAWWRWPPHPDVSL